MEEFELGVLWDEYGLVGDIVVCTFIIVVIVRADKLQYTMCSTAIH